MRKSEIFVVTGGPGFIGKHFVRRCLEQGRFIRNIDNVSYAADCAVMEQFMQFPNHRFHKADISTLDFLPQCDVIFNFAAESHVDAAITNAKNFCITNLLGVQNSKCLPSAISP